MENIFSKLEIPQTIAAGPGPGNTDERVLAAFANAGLADHMHADVLRGMIECKKMLRDVWGTGNIHTFGVAGTGWSGLDMMFSGIQPGDKVVMFVNGTFSGIDGLSARMKARGVPVVLLYCDHHAMSSSPVAFAGGGFKAPCPETKRM